MTKTVLTLLLSFILISVYSQEIYYKEENLSFEEKEAYSNYAQRIIEQVGWNLETLKNEPLPYQIRKELMQITLRYFLKPQNINIVEYWEPFNSKEKKSLPPEEFIKKIIGKKESLYSELKFEWCNNYSVDNSNDLICREYKFCEVLTPLKNKGDFYIRSTIRVTDVEIIPQVKSSKSKMDVKLRNIRIIK